jgi:MFS family permease
VVAEVAAEHRKQAFALIRMAINLGMSLGPALGGVLAKAHFSSLFLVDGLTTLGAAAVLAWALPVGAAPARSAPGEAQPSLWGPLADPRMRSFWLGSVAVATVFFQADSAMPLHLVHNIGLSETTYGLLFTINTVLIVLLEIPLTAAIAHWDTRRTLALGALLVAAGFGLLGLAHDVWGVAATVLVWTLGEMLYSPSSSAYAAELAPPNQRGAYLGLYTAAWSIAFTLAPALGTRGLEQLGALHWAVVFAVGAVGTGLMLAGAQPRPATESAPG